MYENEIKVTVYCLAYNHEKFIRNALEGFVNQKTNFKYEVIVHDDASTDNTTNIIKEYEKKYPNIIKPIYQTENQYAKGIGVIPTYIVPRIKGKYVAACEGDDYWSDNRKLQKQFDYMEEHDECSMCVHNTIKHDLETGKEKLFNNWNEIHELTAQDIFYGWNVHTSSFFIRGEFFEKEPFPRKYWFRDYIRLTVGFYYGKVVALPDIMSVYNWNNSGGITYSVWKKRNAKSLEKIQLKKEYLIEYNKFTNYKYEKIVDKKILEEDFNILIAKLDFIDNTKKEFKEIKKQIESHDLYNKFLKNLNYKESIKFHLKTMSYIVYKFYKYVRRLLKQ